MLMQVQIFVRKVRNKAAGTIGKLLPKAEHLCHLPCDVMCCAMPSHAMPCYWFGTDGVASSAACCAVLCCIIGWGKAIPGSNITCSSAVCPNKQQCKAAMQISLS